MIQHGSKITIFMLIAVFCAFSFAGCGDSDDDNRFTDDDNDSPGIVEEKENDDGDEDIGANDIMLTLISPADGETVESGVVKIVGKAENAPAPGKDKVYIELMSEDGKQLGKSSSLVADLDEEFSADLKYELSDTMKRNDDETVNADLHVYMNDGDGAMAAETTVRIKVK